MYCQHMIYGHSTLSIITSALILLFWCGVPVIEDAKKQCSGSCRYSSNMKHQYDSQLIKYTKEVKLREDSGIWALVTVIIFFITACYIKDVKMIAATFLVASFSLVVYIRLRTKPLNRPTATTLRTKYTETNHGIQSSVNASLKVSRSDQGRDTAVNKVPSHNLKQREFSNYKTAPLLDEFNYATENFDINSPQRIAHSTVMDMQIKTQQHEQYQQRRSGAMQSIYGSATETANQMRQQQRDSSVNNSNPILNSPAATLRSNRLSTSATDFPEWHTYHTSPIQRSPVPSTSQSTNNSDLLSPTSNLRLGYNTTIEVKRNPKKYDSDIFSNPMEPSSTSAASRLMKEASLDAKSAASHQITSILERCISDQEKQLQSIATAVIQQLQMKVQQQPNLLSAEEISKVKDLLELKLERVTVRNGTVGLQDVIQFCKSLGLSQDILQSYLEARSQLRLTKEGANSVTHHKPTTAIGSVSGYSSYSDSRSASDLNYNTLQGGSTSVIGGTSLASPLLTSPSPMKRNIRRYGRY